MKLQNTPQSVLSTERSARSEYRGGQDLVEDGEGRSRRRKGDEAEEDLKPIGFDARDRQLRTANSRKPVCLDRIDGLRSSVSDSAGAEMVSEPLTVAPPLLQKCFHTMSTIPVAPPCMHLACGGTGS